MRRNIVAIACVGAALLAAPAAARAAFTVTPSTTQAGRQADVAIHADFARTPTSVVLRLPPGLLGNPSAAARCTTFATTGCDSDSAVGTASATVTVLGLPVTASGNVYNLAPVGDEPARLGIEVGIPLVTTVRNEASIALRQDGGLDSTIAALDTGGFAITALDLTLDSSFMTLPTSCAAAVTTLDAPPNASQSATFTPTGCGAVPFSPTATVELETPQPAQPSGATISLLVPDSAPIRQSHVRRAEVVLPEGTTLSPGVAAGLETCSEAELAKTCPATSKIGTVEFATPLLGTLAGAVYFGPVRPGAPFRLFVAVDQAGVHLRLAGDVTLDPSTARITTVFDDLPQVPFTRLALSFQGGPRAVLANPRACGDKTLGARLTPWSGGAPVTATATFAIACIAGAFRPGLALAAESTAAGRPAGAVTLEVRRSDADQDLARVTTELPPGLAGSLRGIGVCADAAAAAGACPADTRVGSVSALVGTGAAPVPLAGTVSLTGPFDGGLAGLAIAIPGRVGPVDLGTVVVRAGIVLRPDGGLTVRTAALPRVVGGVPVSIRRLALRLDRAGFILNASSCAAQQVRAVLEGADGATATVEAPYQATDCGALAFTPRLEAVAGARGATAAKSKPPLRTVITVPAGQAATATAQVDLPAALGVDITRLTRLCGPAQLAASACPADSRVGTVTATTPLLVAPLSGPVYLAQRAVGELPGLSLELGGAASLKLFGAVVPQTDGRTRNTFAGIPDVPLERFELAFDSGASGPLVASRDLCRGARPRLGAEFTAHSGATAKLSAPLRVAGCAPFGTLAVRGRTLTLRVSPARDGTELKRVTVTLPRALRGVSVRRLRGARPSRHTRRTLTLTATRGAIAATLRARAVPRRLTLRVSVLDREGRRTILRVR